MRAFSKGFRNAAKAAGEEPEKFARKIRGLLSPRKCRNTPGVRIFEKRVLEAIS